MVNIMAIKYSLSVKHSFTNNSTQILQKITDRIRAQRKSCGLVVQKFYTAYEQINQSNGLKLYERSLVVSVFTFLNGLPVTLLFNFQQIIKTNNKNSENSKAKPKQLYSYIKSLGILKSSKFIYQNTRILMMKSL